MSLLDDLNDNCFVLATEYLVSLSREIEEETGDKPSLQELCDLLAWGLRSCSADILRDADPANVVSIRAKLSRKPKVVLTPGDLIAIPGVDRQCFLAVFITSNRFGYAYGLLAGRHRRKPISAETHLEPLRYPIYSGRRFVAAGRWRIIGNYPHLLGLFPSEPELFHRKRHNEANPEIGPFGSGETDTDVIRHLTEAEARHLGLLDGGDYQQCLLEDEIEALLKKAADENRTSGAAFYEGPTVK